MLANDYPLFWPPYEFFEREHDTWTRKEADQYFQWVMDNMENRIETLLSFLGENLEGTPQEVLLRVGHKVARVMKDHPFSRLSENGERRITALGFSITHDMGLLFAQLLIRESHGALHWGIRRKPKNEISVNYPIIEGFKNDSLDPILIARNANGAIFNNSRPVERWAELYNVWFDMIR